MVGLEFILILAAMFAIGVGFGFRRDHLTVSAALADVGRVARTGLYGAIVVTIVMTLWYLSVPRWEGLAGLVFLLIGAYLYVCVATLCAGLLAGAVLSVLPNWGRHGFDAGTR